MKRIVAKKISKMKGQDYKLDQNITSYRLFQIVIERLKMIIRGFFRRIVFKKVGKKLFIGKHVKFKCGKRIELGKCVTINDYCYINGLSRGGIAVGDNFSLGRNSIIDCTGVISELGESLVIGNNVGISPNLTLFVRGKVEIGDDVIIGPNVTIIAENHKHDEFDTPIRLQGVTRKGIKIGNNCWLGANVIILDGVTIGDNSIVAAGAVVNKNIDPNSVVGGIPAKLIKNR